MQENLDVLSKFKIISRIIITSVKTMYFTVSRKHATNTIKTNFMSKKNETEIIMTLLCASQVLHEAMDELQHLKFYRHSLKQAAKRLEDELTKVCDPIIKGVHPDDEEMFNWIMNGIETVSKQMATMDPAAIAKTGFILQRYQEKQRLKYDNNEE